MTFHDLLFAVGNILILPFWLLMIALPGWAVTRRVMDSWLPIIALALLYAASLIGSFFAPGGGLPADLASLGTAAGIGALLGTPVGATTGWLHLLAFDLFAGRWAYLDSRGRGLPAVGLGIGLFFTLMAGPIGLLIYLALRRGRGT